MEQNTTKYIARYDQPWAGLADCATCRVPYRNRCNAAFHSNIRAGQIATTEVPMSILKAAAALFLFSASCMQASCIQARAWDYKGHKVTGSVADQLLEPNARQQVETILGFKLAVAGPWADCARSVARFKDGTFKYAPNR